MPAALPRADSPLGWAVRNTMRVAKETVVAIEYTLKDDQGTILDASGDRGPMEYLHGAQNIIPGLEQGIEGLAAGDTKNVLVPPQLGYGEYSEKLLQQVPISAFGANTPQVGMRVLTIKKIEGEEVTLDGNHELAGKTLHFDIKVVSVRAAELSELSHGHPHQAGGCCGGGCGSGEGSGGGCCSSEEGSEGGCCSSEKQGGCGSGGCGCSH